MMVEESKKVMIENYSAYTLADVLEYLAGYTTKLSDKVMVREEQGQYYNNVIVTNLNQLSNY